jgi:hypothetical protein
VPDRRPTTLSISSDGHDSITTHDLGSPVMQPVVMAPALLMRTKHGTPHPDHAPGMPAVSAQAVPSRTKHGTPHPDHVQPAAVALPARTKHGTPHPLHAGAAAAQAASAAPAPRTKHGTPHPGHAPPLPDPMSRSTSLTQSSSPDSSVAPQQFPPDRVKHGTPHPNAGARNEIPSPVMSTLALPSPALKAGSFVLSQEVGAAWTPRVGLW